MVSGCGPWASGQTHCRAAFVSLSHAIFQIKSFRHSSMKTRDSFLAFLIDQLHDLDDVSTRGMFGGTGLYSGDLFFGIVYRDIVYFKVDDQTRRDYVRAGTKPFKPYADRPMTMQYYEVPLAVLEDGDELCRWARRAIAAAGRKPRRKPGKARL